MNGVCGVLVEFRQLKKPDGAKQLLAEYNERLRARAAELGQQDGYVVQDLPHQLQKLGVPVQAIAALDRPRETPALDAARTFLRAPKELAVVFLALVGPPGCGKSVAAAHVLRDFRRRLPPNSQPTGSHEPFIWAQASELTSLSAFSDADHRRVVTLKNARALVLDDLGDEATAIGLEQVRNIIMHREGTNRKTVLTSNLKPEAFIARYGAAVADRIQARGIMPYLWGSKSMRQRPTGSAGGAA